MEVVEGSEVGREREGTEEVVVEVAEGEEEKEKGTASEAELSPSDSAIPSSAIVVRCSVVDEEEEEEGRGGGRGVSKNVFESLAPFLRVEKVLVLTE